ncbi:hypothetical protein PoB_007430300, partial [Plakobranchus ocellatus]
MAIIIITTTNTIIITTITTSTTNIITTTTTTTTNITTTSTTNIITTTTTNIIIIIITTTTNIITTTTTTIVVKTIILTERNETKVKVTYLSAETFLKQPLPDLTYQTITAPQLIRASSTFTPVVVTQTSSAFNRVQPIENPSIQSSARSTPISPPISRPLEEVRSAHKQTLHLMPHVIESLMFHVHA